MSKSEKKAAPPKKGKQSKQPKKKGTLSYKILGFLLLVLALLLLPTSMLLVAGMMPSLVAYFTDPDRRKTSAISVGTVNLCGVLPFELTLWQGANSAEQAGQILRHLETWIIMYGAAAVGSVIYYAVPPVIGGFIALQSAARVSELERRQTALREAWGDEVAGESHRPRSARANAQREAA